MMEMIRWVLVTSEITIKVGNDMMSVSDIWVYMRGWKWYDECEWHLSLQERLKWYDECEWHLSLQEKLEMTSWVWLTSEFWRYFEDDIISVSDIRVHKRGWKWYGEFKWHLSLQEM